MSFSLSIPTQTDIAVAPLSGQQLSQELASLMDEIRRTREWFNMQIEAQLLSLKQLRDSMQIDDSVSRTPEAASPDLPQTPASVVPPVPDIRGTRHQHQAIVLPPSKIIAIDPELEQTTLHELNNALALAFSEISARGGMLA